MRSSSSAGISATASVPVASKVLPPHDHNPAVIPAPRSRVYGRPVAEPDGQPGEHPELSSFPPPAAAPAGPATSSGRADHGPSPEPAPFSAFGESGTVPPGAGDDRDSTWSEASSPPLASAQDQPAPGGTTEFDPTPFGPPPDQPPAPGRPNTPGGFNPSPFGPPPDQPPQQGFAEFNPSPFGPPPDQPPAPGRPNTPGGFNPSPFGPPPDQPPQQGFANAPGFTGQSGGPGWAGPPIAEQDRFNAFRPDAPAPAEQKADAPAPQVRNGRVLFLVLTAAVLILTIPLGALYLLGKFGGDEPAAFNPAVGDCVRQEGESAATVSCGDPSAFRVVAKVDDESKCADPNQPFIALPGGRGGKEQVLCLGPANGGSPSAGPGADAEPSTDG